MNGFEGKVINELANLENIVFWHKIIDKKGFRLNGFLNHYPDFLLLTKSGKILLVKSKVNNLDNSDSMRKLRLEIDRFDAPPFFNYEKRKNSAVNKL